jgi:hypothetical protein
LHHIVKENRQRDGPFGAVFPVPAAFAAALTVASPDATMPKTAVASDVPTFGLAAVKLLGEALSVHATSL